MEKKFEEAFGSIEIKPELKDMFRDVTVSRLVMNRKSNTLKMYLFYDRLIPKKFIRMLEKELARKLSRESTFDVKIYEEYRLSEQYTPKIWFESYEESIRMELEEYDIILHTLFRNANPHMDEEDNLQLQLPETPVAKNKEKELVRVLEKIAQERFGYEIAVKVDYVEAKSSRHKEENEARAQRKLDEIIARREAKEGDVSVDETVTAGETEKEKETEKNAVKEEKGTEEKKTSLKKLYDFTKKS